MWENLNELAKGAIIVALIALVIGLVMTGVTIARGFIGEGMQTFSNNMSQASNARFDSYNQKVVLGSEVENAIISFEGMQYGVVVETLKNSGSPVNYNAVLEGSSETDGTGFAKTYEDGDENGYIVSSYNGGEADEIKQYTKIGNIKKKGGREYIKQDAKFDARLIRDESENIIGIYFKQKSSH